MSSLQAASSKHSMCKSSSSRATSEPIFLGEYANDLNHNQHTLRHRSTRDEGNVKSMTEPSNTGLGSHIVGCPRSPTCYEMIPILTCFVEPNNSTSEVTLETHLHVTTEKRKYFLQYKDFFRHFRIRLFDSTTYGYYGTSLVAFVDPFRGRWQAEQTSSSRLWRVL